MTPAKFKAGDRVDRDFIEGRRRGTVTTRKWLRGKCQWTYAVDWDKPVSPWYGDYLRSAGVWSEGYLSAVPVIDQLGELAPTAPAYHEPLTGGTSELPDSP